MYTTGGGAMLRWNRERVRPVHPERKWQPGERVVAWGPKTQLLNQSYDHGCIICRRPIRWGLERCVICSAEGRS
jgi:hypothetical protein